MSIGSKETKTSAGASFSDIIQQFAAYQVTDVSSCQKERVDASWKEIGEIENGKFHHLSLFVRGILTLPHSSAHCERIFSCVQKNLLRFILDIKNFAIPLIHIENYDNFLFIKIMGEKKVFVRENMKIPDTKNLVFSAIKCKTGCKLIR